MSIPGSLAGIGGGVVFGLAGQRLVYFKVTTTMKLPFCFLDEKVVNSDGTTAKVYLLVLPTFLFTVCRGSKLPLRGILGGVVAMGFVHPPMHGCRVRGVCRGGCAIIEGGGKKAGNIGGGGQ